ncbi:MAG: N-acetylmuramoyl-L-alanine amidase, partial [Deltaproteobacteria bacterium]|nr:N-acetylmuramoyl-L-alanine amidase [Deltaproteobacteria bacterium]
LQGVTVVIPQVKKLLSLFILIAIVTTSGSSFGKLPKRRPPPQKKQSLTIVIDPGHGGKDSGAIGVGGRQEKRAALQISQLWKRQLEKKLKARVVLTRSRDVFISLGERNRISKKANAQLFISVHMNAAENKKANGLEIYYLNNATDRASSKLAARENKGIPKEEKDLEAILGTLIQNENTEASALLAKQVHRTIFKRIEAKDLGVKTALFYVLVGPGCPSLLIESGFMSHPEEGKKLFQKRYQEEIVLGITEGIEKYLTMSQHPRSNL